MSPAHDRSHYKGDFKVRAARVRAAAKADPLARCWRCGKTLTEVPGSKWQAGHTVDGNSSHPLAAEHSTCNQSAGAAMGNRKRAPQPLGLNPSRRWY